MEKQKIRVDFYIDPKIKRQFEFTYQPLFAKWEDLSEAEQKEIVLDEIAAGRGKTFTMNSK